jgi:phage terminase large subunit
MPLWEYLESGGKRAVAVWHRRSGKDDTDLHITCVKALERIGTYWYLLPLATQARKAIWEAVNPHSGKRRIDEAFPREIRENTRENEMFIRLKNGSTWQVVGSDNYDSLVGSPPVGVVFSEWALSDPKAWAYLRPILLENGGWALFNYTPRGRNHGYTTFESAKDDPNWFVQRLTVDDTNVFTKEQLAQERKEIIRENGEVFGEAIFQQEYYCSFQAAILGAYYGREMTAAENGKRITRVPWEPQLEVYTAWDLGIGDSTSIWFVQLVGREIHIIDYIESSGVGLDHYAAELRRGERSSYVYAEHLLPHDGEAKELGTGKTRIETLRSLHVGKIRVVPKQAVEDGINAARLIIPRCWFDQVKCERGIEALRQYKREWDDEKKTFAPRPSHDWTSHAADAFRYLALGLNTKPKQDWKQPSTRWVA